MYARVLTFSEVNDFEQALSFVQETGVPAVRSQRGYQGLSVSVDRAGRTLVVLSLWETEADREASESALAKTREEGRDLFAGGMKAEAFEQLVVEMSRPPEVGSSLLVSRVSMDPANVDDNIAYFKAEVLPQITSAPGFRAVRALMNKQTGEGMVGTLWDDEQSMSAGREAALARRPTTEARGVSFGDLSSREVAFIDLP